MSRFALLVLTSILFLGGCLGSRMASELDTMGFEWVPIEGGAYEVGDTFESENDDALPVHTVLVEDFEISRYETTFAQYDWFARQTGRALPLPDIEDRGNQAVGGVTWAEAMAFCEYIGGRLPTEVEWEYAAAGGSEKQLYPGTDDESKVNEYVRHRQNSVAFSFPVGTKKPNFFGLYDMGGNVAEWVDDYYEKYPEPGEEPVYNDFEVSDMRVARGGSFANESGISRTYWRAGTLN